jgi:hypothetical protein
MYKKDKFDITICYKKVFDMLSTTCNVQGVVEMVSDYADVSIVVVDIGGNVIATSLHTANQDMTDETFGKLISACVEQREYGESSIVVEEAHHCVAVNGIEINGNTEAFGIASVSKEDIDNPERRRILIEVNDMVCRALGIVMERGGPKVRYPVSTLRHMFARSLFEADESELGIQDIQNIYNKEVIPSFIVAVLELSMYDTFIINKIGSELTEAYPKSFVYINGKQMYILFTDTHGEGNEQPIYHLLEKVCEKYQASCGVSEVFDTIELIEKKKFMISKAREIGRTLDPEKKVYMEYDYYIRIVCSCAAPYIGQARYQENGLQKLKEEDQMKGTEFYNTLKAYLLQGGNVSATARQLFIHRNTMIYRLSKINEILGVDINEPSVSRRLLISIVLQEYEY